MPASLLVASRPAQSWGLVAHVSTICAYTKSLPGKSYTCFCCWQVRMWRGYLGLRRGPATSTPRQYVVTAEVENEDDQWDETR